jgi:hypothetical protein
MICFAFICIREYTRPRDEFNQGANDMPSRTPRETLEWLAAQREDLWHQDGSLNIYRLAKELAPYVSQSTLDRLYRGVSKAFSESTLDALSSYFSVPKSALRGEASGVVTEVGADITLSELRLLSQFRRLKPERKRLVAEQVRIMLH